MNILEKGTPYDACPSKLVDRELWTTNTGSTTAGEKHSLSSGSTLQPKAVSESSHESDNDSTSPSTAPTTPLVMNYDSLKLLPPRDVKSPSLSAFILSLDLYQLTNRIGEKNCYNEEAEAQRKQRAFLDAIDLDLSKKRYRETFASYLLGHRIGSFPPTWIDCQDVAARIPGIYKKLPDLRRWIPNDLEAEYDQVRLEREEECEKAPNKEAFLRGVVEWKIMCNASKMMKTARSWTQRSVLQKAHRSMDWLCASGGNVKASPNALHQSVSGMERKSDKMIVQRHPHHYSFSGREVYHKSNTPLAVSFWVTQSANLDKHFPQQKVLTLRHVLAAEAARYVDSYLWYGPPNIPKICGTALQEFATGFLEKSYYPEGTWMNDRFGMDEDVPRVQLENSPHYDAGVADVIELPIPYSLDELDSDFAFKDGGRLHMYGHPKKRKGLTNKAQANRDSETDVPAIFPSRLRQIENVEYPIPSTIRKEATQTSTDYTRPIAVRLPPTPISIFYGQHSRLIGHGYSSSHVLGEMALPPTIRTNDTPSSINAEVQQPVNNHVRKNRRRIRKNNNSIVVNLPLPKVVSPRDSAAVATEQPATVEQYVAVEQHAAVEQYAASGEEVSTGEKCEELSISVPDTFPPTTTLTCHHETTVKTSSSQTDSSPRPLTDSQPPETQDEDAVLPLPLDAAVQDGIEASPDSNEEILESSEAQDREAVLPLPRDMLVPDVIEATRNAKEEGPELSTSITARQGQLGEDPTSESQDSTELSVSLQTVARPSDDNVVSECVEIVGRRRKRSSTPLVVATLPALITDFVDHDKQSQSPEAMPDVSLTLKNVTIVDASPADPGAEPVFTIYQDPQERFSNDLEDQFVGRPMDDKLHPNLVLRECSPNSPSLRESTASKQVVQTNRLASILDEMCRNGAMHPGDYEVVVPDTDSQSTEGDSPTSATDLLQGEDVGEPFSENEFQLDDEDIEALEDLINGSDDDADFTSAFLPVGAINETIVPEHASIEYSEATNKTERIMSAEAFEATLRLETEDNGECLSTPFGHHFSQSPHSKTVTHDQVSDSGHSPDLPSRPEDLSSNAGAEVLATADAFSETGSKSGAISTILDASCPVEAAPREGSEGIQSSFSDDATSREETTLSSNPMAIESSEENQTVPHVQFSNSVETILSPDGVEIESNSVTPPLSQHMASDQPEHAKSSIVPAQKRSERSETTFQSAVSSLIKAPQSTANTTVINIEGLIATPLKAEPGTIASIHPSRAGRGFVCSSSRTEQIHPKPARIASEDKAEPSAPTGSMLTNCLVYGSIVVYIGYRAWKAFKR